MQRTRIVLLGILLLFGASMSTAFALTNGPVNWTVGLNTYQIFYSTIAYASIEQNYIDQNGAAPSAINKAPTTTSATPNFAAGTFTIPGLGAYPGMMQPWWNPDDSSSAQSAALAWFNKTGWPINDGLQYPNAGPSTPRFVYGYNDGLDKVKWVSYTSSGGFDSGETSINDSSVSYALSGVSN